MATLQDILQGVSAYTEQNTDLPTGDDLNARVQYAQMADREWAAKRNWKVLETPYTFGVTLATQATISLPANFDHLNTAVYVWDSATSDLPRQYLEIPEGQKYDKLSSDYYVYTNRQNLIVNPVLTSGATLSLVYQSKVSLMATLTDTAVCPDPAFIMQRVTAYVLESRGDSRFPQVKFDAQQTLQQMLENENVGSGGMENRIDNYYRQQDFVIGRD